MDLCLSCLLNLPSLQSQFSYIRASLFPLSSGLFRTFWQCSARLASVQHQALSSEWQWVLCIMRILLRPLAEETSPHKLFCMSSCVSSSVRALSIQNVQYLCFQTGKRLRFRPQIFDKYGCCSLIQNTLCQSSHILILYWWLAMKKTLKSRI